MSLNKSNNPLLNTSGSGYVTESFVTNNFSLNDSVVSEVLQNFQGGKQISVLALMARKFTIIINNNAKVDGYLGELALESEGEKFITLFYPFFIQTDKNLFLLIATDFNIYEHISQDPFILEDAVDEFHNSIKKCLGIRYGQAYFGTTYEKVEKNNTGLVAVLTNNFNQLRRDGKSYILFTL